MATLETSENDLKKDFHDYAYKERDNGASNHKDSEQSPLLKDDKSASLSPPRNVTPRKDSSGIYRRISSHSSLPTVLCPTCSGKGKLSQAQSDTMLALIPMHDRRLKPKRTKLKLAIAFALLLIIGGMCFGFLFPRTVNISIVGATVQNISQFTSKVKIQMQVDTCLNNTNFFTVDLDKINVQVLFLETKDMTHHEVGNRIINETIHLALRKIKKRSFPVATTYTGTDAMIVKRQCLKYKQYFLIKILLTANVKYWLHSEQISASKFYYIDCENADVTHLRPP